MNRKFKSFIALMLVAFLLVSFAPVSMLVFGITANAVSVTALKNGEIIQFGSYPQSQVTDKATIAALGKLSAKWISYGYCSGDEDYGTMKTGNYMKYADVTYKSVKYRAVKFTKYRPVLIFDSCTMSNSAQSANGYEPNRVYWFKYEPLTWKILDRKSGFAVCTKVIDSQPYSSAIYCKNENDYYNNSKMTTYANDYASSSIRKWLNADFYNTAFSSTERKIVASSKLNNKAYSAKFDSSTTTDKVFLLSRSDVLNKNYGFPSSASAEDSVKKFSVSAYAASQGLYTAEIVKYAGHANCLLRTASNHSKRVCRITYEGTVDNNCGVDSTNNGIVPAIKLNVKSNISASVIRPARVTGIKASNKTPTTAVLSWKKVSGADKYYVLWYNAKEKSYKKLGETAKTSCSLKALNAGEKYTFAVQAVRIIGSEVFKGTRSKNYAFTTPKTYYIPAVTGLKCAEKSTTTAVLSWNKVAGADEYIVLWYNTETKKYKQLGRTAKLSCSINSLKPGTNYTFAVKAVKIVDSKEYQGKASKAFTFKTVTNSAANKMKVQSFTTSARTTSSSTLTWKGVNGAAGYAIYMYQSGKWVKVADVKATRCIIKKLKSGRTYKYKVTAYKISKGVVLYGADSDVLTTSTKPETPKVTAKAAGKGKITVTCSKVKNASGYFLYYSTSKNGSYKKYAQTKSTKLTHKFTSGKTYYIKAKAYKAIGKVNYVSGYSAPVRVKAK